MNLLTSTNDQLPKAFKRIVVDVSQMPNTPIPFHSQENQNRKNPNSQL
jgi:hypothetical protein